MEEGVVKKIRMIDWEKRWMLTQIPVANALILGTGYYKLLQKDFGKNLHQNFFVFSRSRCVCYQSKKANIAFGEHIAQTCFANEKQTRSFVAGVAKVGEVLWRIAKMRDRSTLDLGTYRSVEKLTLEWFSGYVAILRGANYLSPKRQDAILPILNAYRTQTEELYPDVCEWFERHLARIAQKEKISSHTLRLLSVDECVAYLSDGTLPSMQSLKSRYPMHGYFFERGKGVLLSKGDVERFERMVDEQERGDSPMIKGAVAYPGRITGIVRIVRDPRSVGVFRAGDILVTEMTHPEFVPLMKKAGAIVTDAGGILCHAAIVSRELKKPCVIGTQRATRMFKTGDRVHVDANNGTVSRVRHDRT